jgi:hypothetical protein
LFVITKELRPHVESLFVDSKRKFKVARPVWNRGKLTLKYSDHFPVLLSLTNLPRAKEEKEEKAVRWNLAKEGGWENYKVLGEKCKKAFETEEKTIEEAYKIFEKQHDKICFKAFGKVTISNQPKNIKTKYPVNNDDEQVAKELNEEQVKRTDEEMTNIKKSNNGKVGQVWEIKKRVMGGKRAAIDSTAVINPKTGKLVVSRKEIKEVSLNYCIETLANNKPEESVKEHIENKKKFLKVFLKLKGGNFGTSKETFDLIVDKFKRSRKRLYDFLTKAGSDFKDIVFKLCQRMFQEEIFPSDFQKTTLHMIFKNGCSGRKEILSDNRFIHSKLFFARTTEALVVEDGLKWPLLKGSSKYQIGGQPGHRSEELIFVVKSMIAKYRMCKKQLVVKLFDISKFFDKEMIEDAIITCLKRGCDQKAVRLWYKLNESTQIRVRTGAGMSQYAKVGPVLGQGTLAGALISQAVLDDGVIAEFSPGGLGEPGEPGQPMYGTVPMAPVIFQDDLQNSSENIIQARFACVKVDKVVKKLGLQLNREKSVCLIIGSKKQKQEASAELLINPLMCGQVEIKEKQVAKWLGQQVSSAGLADSVEQTVLARQGKIRGACLEVANIVNDWRSQVAGGMETALVLWELCCVPSLLHGAGTWVEISPGTEKRLNSIHQDFLRSIYQVGPGAPLASLCWDTMTLDMGLRVWLEKVMMIVHIRSLEEDALARTFHKEQVAMAWPGLAKETKLICQELDIEDCNITSRSKSEYRQIVLEACHRKNKTKLLGLAEGKIKCERIMKEEYHKKDYISKKLICEVRQQYKSRYGLLPFAGNFSKDKRFAKSDWMCRCGQTEKEIHLTAGKCPIYDDIREKYISFENDEDLVSYFKEILDRRDLLDRLEAEEKELEDD